MSGVKRLENVKVDILKPYERNAKKHPDHQLDLLVESIKEFGFLTPCLIDSDYNLIAGHGRVEAAKRIGMESVPCVFVEGLTDEQRRAYILADNRLSELGEWDMDLVNEELDELAELDFDITLTGFDIPEDENPQEITEDEYEGNPETKCKIGDLWQLGDHRLLCGDSTEPSSLEKLLEGGKAELLLTDPPYGINVVKGNEVGGGRPLHFGKVGGGNIVNSKVYSAIIGDETTDTARNNYSAALPFTENQIIFGGNYFTDFLPPFRCWIVWDKQNTGNFADAELAWTSFDRGVKLYHFMWNGLAREGSRTVEGVTRVHPTQKPVGMIGYIINDFSKENESILDCFGGSGSTMIACEQLNRKCYMVELDPHYCDVIIDRWEQFTGRKAVLLNG